MIAKRSDRSTVLPKSCLSNGCLSNGWGVLALAVLTVSGVLCSSNLSAQNDIFTLGNAAGVAGSTVSVPLTATHDNAMQGFSVALSFDPLNLDLLGTDFTGTAVETILGGVDPAYAEVQIDNTTGTMTAGVIFGFGPVPPLNQLPQIPASPTTSNSLMNINFEIGQTNPTTIPIILEESLAPGNGGPLVTTTYSNDGFSVTLDGRVDGSVEVTNLSRFYFDPMVVVPGGTLNAVVRCDHPMDDMGGFQLALTYDSAKLSFQAPSVVEQYWLGTDLGAAIAPETIEVLDIRTQAQTPTPGIGFLAISAQFDFTAPLNGQNLPAGSGHSLIRINFNVANNIGLVGQTADILFVDGIVPANPGGPLLPPATNVVITTAGGGIPPILEGGLVEIIAGPSFIRGDYNEDGVLNLADPIALLSFLFSGGLPPGCGSAADFNDDGGTDISDAIFALTYLFNDGPQPAHPFPGCGIDSTPNFTLLPCDFGTAPCP